MEEYWWCPRCECVFMKKAWNIEGKMGKFGMCPNLCSTSGRKAVHWPIIAKRHGYPLEPVSGESYPVDKLF